MTDHAPRRRNNNSALAVIVIALLGLMGLIAFLSVEGRRNPPDSDVTAPLDERREDAIMPTPVPGAPAPGESPARR